MHMRAHLRYEKLGRVSQALKCRSKGCCIDVLGCVYAETNDTLTKEATFNRGRDKYCLLLTMSIRVLWYDRMRSRTGVRS